MKKQSHNSGGRHAYKEETYAEEPSVRQQTYTSRPKQKRYKVVFIIALIVFVASLVTLGVIGYQYWSQNQAYTDLETHVSVPAEHATLADLTVDWDTLQDINPDIVAWIYIPDTPVNYPVVQGSDNSEYLHKAFDGSTGWLASAGTIFLDAHNSAVFNDQNSAMYGHHMNDGSMFAELADWEDSDEFNKHRDIYILTPRGNYRLTTFAVVVTTGSDAIVQANFSTPDDYQAYIQDKLDRSRVTQEGTVIQASDVRQSFLLSTCEYTRNDGRAVVFASVVETTVKGNPYMIASPQGSTGLSHDESAEIGEEYQEAA